MQGFAFRICYRLTFCCGDGFACLVKVCFAFLFINRGALFIVVCVTFLLRDVVLCIHFNSVTILNCSVSISKSDVLRTLARKDKLDTEKRDNVPKLTESKKAALPKVIIENEYL